MNIFGGALAGLALLGGALSTEDPMTASELEDKYKDYSYSYLYCGGENLLERLEDILQYQFDVEAQTAVNDAIIYIRNHFCYY